MPPPIAPGIFHGRSGPLEVIEQAVSHLEPGRTRVILVEGEPGMGKSSLVREALRFERPSEGNPGGGFGIPRPVYWGRAGHLSASSPYQVWRPIFLDLLGLDPTSPVLRQRDALRERFDAIPLPAHYAPLTNPILRLGFSETRETRSLQGGTRELRTQSLLIRLLLEHSREQPLVLVLDDMDRADSLSWHLLQKIVWHVESLLVIIPRTTGPRRNPTAPWLEELDPLRIELSGLTTEELGEMACTLLGATACGYDVSSTLFHAVRGHPLWTGVVCRLLHEQGRLSVRGGRIWLDSTGLPEDLDELRKQAREALVPRHLGPLRRMLLLLAAIHDTPCGIDVELAARVGLADGNRDRLRSLLEDLCREHLLVPFAVGEATFYHLSHSLLREALLQRCRRAESMQLHRRLAEVLERLQTDPEGIDVPPDLLARLWQNADLPRAAIPWMGRAGAEASLHGAYSEAVRHYLDVLDLEEGGTGEPAPDRNELRRARWEFRLGDAYLALGQLTHSQAHFTESLRLVGVRFPQWRPGLWLGILLQSLVQALHLVVRPAGRGQPSHRRDRYLVAASAAERISELWFYTDFARWQFSVLLSVNLADRAGEPVPLARPYAVLGFVMGRLAHRRLAGRYFHRSLAIGHSQYNHADLSVCRYVMSADHVSRGHLHHARRIATEALQHARTAMEPHAQGMSLTMLAMVHFFSGRFQEGLHCYRELAEIARTHENAQHRSWSRYGTAMCLYRLGRYEEAIAHLESALPRLQEAESRFICRATLALLYLHQGLGEQAWAEASLAESLIDELPLPIAFVVLEGYSGLLEYQSRCQLKDVHRTLSRTRIRRVTKSMVRFCRMHPLGRPRLEIHRGLGLAIRGATVRARRHWRRALALAANLHMPLDEALAHHCLGHWTPPGADPDVLHRDRATELFQGLSCPNYKQGLAPLPLRSPQRGGPGSRG